MLDQDQKHILAILFAGGEAVEVGRVSEAIGVDAETVVSHLPRLREALEESGMPFELLCLDGRLQLCTAAEYAPVIQKALELRRNQPLSQAALEVLAIIAYNQPVTRSFVEQVRGVDSSGVVTSLQEKGLIEEAGRLELPGRPISYKTTANFLRCFGMESIEQLPKLPNADSEPLEETLAEEEEFDALTLEEELV